MLRCDPWMTAPFLIPLNLATTWQPVLKSMGSQNVEQLAVFVKIAFALTKKKCMVLVWYGIWYGVWYMVNLWYNSMVYDCSMVYHIVYTIWWEIAYMVYLYGRCLFYGISYGVDMWWVDFIWYLCMVDACSMVYHMVNIYGKNVYGTSVW